MMEQAQKELTPELAWIKDAKRRGEAIVDESEKQRSRLTRKGISCHR